MPQRLHTTKFHFNLKDNIYLILVRCNYIIRHFKIHLFDKLEQLSYFYQLIVILGELSILLRNLDLFHHNHQKLLRSLK